MKNWSWVKTPARIVSIRKWESNLGSLHIEAVLEESRKNNGEVEPNKVTIDWGYAPLTKTSNRIKGNIAPACFDWAYQFAEEGMNVIIHHCLDNNVRYFYCS